MPDGYGMSLAGRPMTDQHKNELRNRVSALRSRLTKKSETVSLKGRIEKFHAQFEILADALDAVVTGDSKQKLEARLGPGPPSPTKPLPRKRSKDAHEQDKARFKNFIKAFMGV